MTLTTSRLGITNSLFVALLGVNTYTLASVLIPHSTLTLTNQLIAPDGFQRSAIVVNGEHPGPLIQATKGDGFMVNVVNQLTDPTMQRAASVHWHGLSQRGTNWADGATGVNQCPISPNHSFEYTFTGGDSQAGTFWYHSHYFLQYCDGLRGPLVIYDPEDPWKNLYDVDDESTVLTLADWYHTPFPSIPGFPLPESTLINGKGRYPDGPNVDLSIVNVEKGKRYRFRLVSLACETSYLFGIDGHQLQVIETDGQNTVPVVVDKLRIFAGQRYSFVLDANQNIDNYWVRSLPANGMPKLVAGYEGGINSAILRYRGAPISDPQTNDNQNLILLEEAKLVPAQDPFPPGNPTAGGADFNVTLNFVLDVDLASGEPQFKLNDKVYRPPSVPILLKILSGARRPEELLPEGNLFSVPRDKVIEVTVPGGIAAGPHPMHLHGHTFSVVKSAGKNNQPNYLTPVRRDVTATSQEVDDYITIRFTTDNPGPWLLHCHLNKHHESGMVVVFVADVDSVAEENPVPDAWNDLCPIYDALSDAEKEVKIVSSLPMPV
uniref:Benzenediol:oxygen oxidoreductase n=1 Tax=Coprinus comatus TaxID=56187 RepID=X5JA14_COPCM|nr:benzenediol:oxygen oxidoreductase [Coprinus comatus]